MTERLGDGCAASLLVATGTPLCPRRLLLQRVASCTGLERCMFPPGKNHRKCRKLCYLHNWPSQPRQLKLWQLPDSRAGFELTQIHEISLGSEEIESNTYPREGTDRYCHERHDKGPRVQVNNPSQPQQTVCKSLWAFEIHAPIQVVFLVFNRMEVACTLYP